MFGRQSRKDLRNLVAHLKKTNHDIRRKACKSLRSYIEEESVTTIEFMRRNEGLSVHPYMFVSGKGKVLGYTQALEVALDLKKDIKGTHYLDVFYPQGNQNVKDELENYFSSPAEIVIPYEIKKGKKVRKLTIIKEAPVYKEIEIDFLNGGKKLRAVAYVPIKVGPRRNSVRKFIGLSSKDQKEIESQIHEATVNLFLHHKWSFEKSEKYRTAHGTNGLIKEYQRLEKSIKWSDSSVSAPSTKTQTTSSPRYQSSPSQQNPSHLPTSPKQTRR